MDSKQIREICIRELLYNERFLRDYQSKLYSLHKNTGFMFEIKQISKSVAPELEFSFKPECKEYKHFKKEQINESLYNANVYHDYEDFRDIVDDVQARGKTRLSAIISIYYAMRYLDYEAKSEPKEATSSNSAPVSSATDLTNADFRTKWPAEYRCDDGHKVRSKGEQLVDNWLYNHNICHGYEPLVRDKINKREYISDFYIPQYCAYIEVWGLETPEYLSRKAKKIEAYKANNLKLIQITDADIKVLDDFMCRNFK